MEEKKGNEELRGHLLVVPYPSQGHINPMLQFSKRLTTKSYLGPFNFKVTLAITNFISTTTMRPADNDPSALIHLDTISDGFDSGGFSEAESTAAYLSRLESEGSKTLTDLIIKYRNTSHPITAIVYDSFLPWALEVAKKFGLPGAVFFTQTCAVNYIYHMVHIGQLEMPVASAPVTLPGLPPLGMMDLPSYLYAADAYPDYAKMLLQQFKTAEKADWVLVNTFYKLEAEVVDAMSKMCTFLTIGPTIPSIYLDSRVEDDRDYGLHLFNLDRQQHDEVIGWIQAKPPKSVVFVSFGSMAALSSDQMEEIAWGLSGSGCYFLWVVRESEESKISKNFKEELKAEQGRLVRWSRQLEVLSSGHIGCFLSHCGWNSTIEALSLGVPMVAMPQWTDQTTNAKMVEDVWKMGVRVRVGEEGRVGREEIERCIRELMEGESGKEMAENASKWKELAVEAVSEGGTSDHGIADFISNLIRKTS